MLKRDFLMDSIPTQIFVPAIGFCFRRSRLLVGGQRGAPHSKSGGGESRNLAAMSKQLGFTPPPKPLLSRVSFWLGGRFMMISAIIRPSQRQPYEKRDIIGRLGTDSPGQSHVENLRSRQSRIETFTKLTTGRFVGLSPEIPLRTMATLKNAIRLEDVDSCENQARHFCIEE